MRVIRHLPRLAARVPRAVLTLGNFDGVHRGHQAIIARARAEADARNGSIVALTFHPHPLAVLAPARAPAMIQSLRDRLDTLRGAGVDVAVAQRFTRAFSALDPDAFVERFLLPSIELLHVVVGYNVTFGRGRTGTAETLAALGARLGFGVDQVGPVRVGDEAVSSSAVRRAIGTGDVALAESLLGRAVGLRGRVVTGERRGRTLGFPTANLHVKPGVLLPADGVYAVRARIDGLAQPAVLNVGVRPTFGELRRTIEAHVLDWQGDLYGRWLELDLVARLRGEQRFDGPAALVTQITADVAAARAVLGAATRAAR
jgi:riboflavin kinase / FMN adenylyltransferase